MNFKLKENSREEIDLNADNLKDVLFKVDDVSGNRARVYIKRISDACAPNPEKTTTISSEAENISFNKTENTGNLSLLIIFLISGILLALLAVLIVLLKRNKNQGSLTHKTKVL